MLPRKAFSTKTLFFFFVYLFACIGFFLTFGYIAILLGLTKTKGTVDLQRSSFRETGSSTLQNKKTTQSWQTTEEWLTLRQAIINDREAISRAASLFHVSPRLVVAIISVEQLRLYTDNREVFKKFFAPLVVLGVQNQYSWGVAGIKRETAIETENHLVSSSSPFYPGKSYEKLLQFTSNDAENERFLRLTDKNDRFYSYLYTAAVIKELSTQWEKEGFPITTNSGVLATLYNIGFKKSIPKQNPQIGGSVIEIGGIDYSFGDLAKRIYESNELTLYFPK